MRTRTLLAGIGIATAALLWGLPQQAGADRAAALRVIDQAIEAHGGPTALARLSIVERNATGKMIVFGKEREFTSDSTWNFPGRFRDVAGLTGDDGNKIPIVLVINGKTSWRQVSGQTQELDGEPLKDVLDELHVLRVATLTPLKENEFTLDTQAEAKVDGRPALVVTASAKGSPDCTLYFDKTSSLLLKVERKAKVAGIEFVKALSFGGHKGFDGVQLPTKITETLNGKMVVELTVNRYRLPRVLEGRPFEKP
jgi:hypothetical protein